MRDIHCHILPGVDDGAHDVEESLAMLEAAKRAGITEITCTPHCRDPYFDYDAMWDAFELLESRAGGFPIFMGFEVNAKKLRSLGTEWIDRLAFDATDEFLLELPTHARSGDIETYKPMIQEIQSHGYRVIIAHPERCSAIRDDIGVAADLADMGCALQASCDFIAGGRAKKAKPTALHLFKAGLYSYIASDAHHVGHYGLFAQAQDKFGDSLIKHWFGAD